MPPSDKPFELVPAATLGDARLAALFARAYADYFVPVHMTEELLRSMVRNFDLDLEASRVVLRDGHEVGVAMLGLRGERAWIGGMGVVPEARRGGAGRALMQGAIGQSRARAVRAVQLEVLVQNAGAYALYEQLGFRTTRDLDVWSLTAPLEAPGAREIAPDEARAWIDAHRGAAEPWQRANESLAHFAVTVAPLRGLEVRVHGERVAAALGMATSERASLLQCAASGPGSEDAVRALCAAARAWAPVLRFLNVPGDDPAAAVLRAAGGTLEAQQHEMVLALDGTAA